MELDQVPARRLDARIRAPLHHPALSEVKKSGKTFLAAVIAIWEAVANADSEVV